MKLVTMAESTDALRLLVRTDTAPFPQDTCGILQGGSEYTCTVHGMVWIA